MTYNVSSGILNLCILYYNLALLPSTFLGYTHRVHAVFQGDFWQIKVFFLFLCCSVVYCLQMSKFVIERLLVLPSLGVLPCSNVEQTVMPLLRPHSIILASCKPGCKPGFQPGFRQVRAGFQHAFDQLSTFFFVKNLVANRSRFARSCTC